MYCTASENQNPVLQYHQARTFRLTVMPGCHLEKIISLLKYEGYIREIRRLYPILPIDDYVAYPAILFNFTSSVVCSTSTNQVFLSGPTSLQY